MRLLWLAAFATAVGAAELTPRWKAKEETTTSLTIEQTTTRSDGELADVGATVETLSIVYGEKVDEVKDGKPTKLRRKYAKYETRFTSVFGGKEMGSEVKKHPLAGKVFTFVHGKATKPIPDVLHSVDWEALLPGADVDVGETWVTDRAHTLTEITGVYLDFEAVCTLKSVDKKTGDATIVIKGEEEAQGARVVFEGTMVFSKKHGKVLRVDLTGKRVVREGKRTATTTYKIVCTRRVAK